MAEVSAQDWLMLGLGAALVGMAKTAVSGAGALAVVLFALALPVRESTGALLPLLLAGDVLALSVYRRHADWALLQRLLPGVLPGMLLGAWFLQSAGDRQVRVAIGAMLLTLLGYQLLAGRRLKVTEPAAGGVAARRALAVLTGAGAGFATMTANAAGPLMTSYLLLLAIPTLSFLGTVGWFFFLVNLAKLPFSTGLGLISREALLVDLLLLPALVMGAWVGALLIRRVDRSTFERSALAAGLLSACLLVVNA